MTYEPGDHVEVFSWKPSTEPYGKWAWERGVVHEADGQGFYVQLDHSQEIIWVPAESRYVRDPEGEPRPNPMKAWGAAVTIQTDEP